MAPPKSQPPRKHSKPKPKPKHENPRLLKRKRDADEIESLNSRIAALESGQHDSDKFADLPLSKPTAKGLEKAHFSSATDVQQKAIPLALQGSDILGAAKTGSGKTLAFLIPVLENLYRQRWTDTDGLGAMILAPTRELAIQIFEVLRKIGRYHTFSAGLVIGGKSLQEERERLPRMNILICTPGRMLQHLDQTASLGLDNLQMLVLDEADRIMDMGFKSTVDAIVEHLPTSRQTMLFSATQTKKLDDLRRLSVQDPQYISVHEKAETATPKSLQQYYIVSPLPEKLNTLWSFIRSNTKSKTLVFLSSAKQVRFIYETFRHMQPGMSLLHLHGRQKQTARLDITKRFSSMQHACLFATDVAARGLDFPAVDWVIQVDCPEDVDTYIHRVGRTARYERDGRAVLFLDPTEEQGMLKRLEQKKIPIELIKVREKKQETIQHQLQNMCFKDPEIKYLGQKAFISYARSVHVQHDKEVFHINKLPLQEFAISLGLPGAPKVKFQKGVDVKAIKNRSRAEASSSEDEDAEKPAEKKDGVRTKYDRMFERQNQDVMAPHRLRMLEESSLGDAKAFKNALDEADGDDDFLSVRRRLDEADLSDAEDGDPTANGRSGPGDQAVIHVSGGADLPVDSKRREKMLKSKKALLKYAGKGSKLLFDDDGNAHEAYEMADEEAFNKDGDAAKQRQQFVDLEAARVEAADVTDKELMKQKRREKREKQKARTRAEVEEEDDDQRGVQHDLPMVEMEYLGNDSDGHDSAGESPAPELVKKPKKWFQKDDTDSEEEDGKRGKKKRKIGKGMLEDAETLEDLEALAEGYL